VDSILIPISPLELLFYLKSKSEYLKFLIKRPLLKKWEHFPK